MVVVTARFVKPVAPGQDIKLPQIVTPYLPPATPEKRVRAKLVARPPRPTGRNRRLSDRKAMLFRSSKGTGNWGSGAGGRGSGPSNPPVNPAFFVLEREARARARQQFRARFETALPDPRPLIPDPRECQRGASALWLVVIFVPVLLGLAGFALDLGMLYSAKGELKTAASAMALAAAQNLIGTDSASTNAQAAAMVTVQNTVGPGNKYNFQGLAIGQTTGSLASTISAPAYYTDAADAIASTAPSGSEVASAQAKYVRMTVTGETPLIFWGLLPVASTRKVAVTASAVAGISAPLCLACGIEPFAVAAANQSDTTDFGFVPAQSTPSRILVPSLPRPLASRPSPPPPILGGASSTLSYLLINRLDPTNTVFPDETSQAYQDGAGGMPGNTNTAQACFRINNVEVVWADATINRCGVPVALVVDQRDLRPGCALRIFRASGLFQSWSASIRFLRSIRRSPTSTATRLIRDYTGNGRRIITIPVVDTLSADRDDRARIPPVSARAEFRRGRHYHWRCLRALSRHVHRQRGASAAGSLRWLQHFGGAGKGGPAPMRLRRQASWPVERRRLRRGSARRPSTKQARLGHSAPLRAHHLCFVYRDGGTGARHLQLLHDPEDSGRPCALSRHAAGRQLLQRRRPHPTRPPSTTH